MSAKQSDQNTLNGAVELTEEEIQMVGGGAALLLPAVQKVENLPTKAEFSPTAGGPVYKQR